MNGSTPIPVSSSTTTTSTYPSHGQQVFQASLPQDAASTAAAALSEQHTPTPNEQASHGRKRKASGAPGSRGVANLTPEQLAKKRANDREAQRAIRERTRTNIESLERRIRELESQQPFQEMQRVAAERDRALEENAHLRHRLAAVAGIAAPGSAGSGGSPPAGEHPAALNGTLPFDDYVDPTRLTHADAELAALSAQQSQLPTVGPQEQAQAQSQYAPHSAAGAQLDSHLHPSLRSPATYTSSVSSTGTGASTYPVGEGSLRRWSPSLDHLHQQQHIPYAAPLQKNGLLPHEYPIATVSGTRAIPVAQMNGDRLGLDFLLDGKSQSPNAGLAQLASLLSPNTSLYSRLPTSSEPTCPLDSLLIDFTAARHQLLQNGMPMREVLGPDFPSFAALYDPNTKDRNDCHAISALLIDILSKFPDISDLPEKVAVLFVMFLVMHWYICPCEMCYERLPEWMRPLPELLESPHPIWINFLPWPSMRRRLCTTSQVKFEEFFVPYTTTLSLNWPFASEQVLERADEAPGGMKMSDVFETHLRDLSNWSLGAKFQLAFPDLVEEVRIRD